MPDGEVGLSAGGHQRKMISRYADTVGDGTGTVSFAGNYSSAAEQAIIAAGPREDYVISRLIVSYEDGQGMRAEHYGTLGAALSNGISVGHYDSGGVLRNDLTSGVPVLKNGDWSSLCYDAQVLAWGAGDEIFAARWTFSKAGQDGIHLGAGESLRINLNDDFTGLVQQRFMFQGYHSYLLDIL